MDYLRGQRRLLPFLFACVGLLCCACGQPANESRSAGATTLGPGQRDVSERNYFVDPSAFDDREMALLPDTATAGDEAPGFQIELIFVDHDLVDERTRTLIRAAANRWELSIVGDVPSIEIDGGLTCNGHRAPQYIDDLVVFVSVAYLDGEENLLGLGVPCAARQEPPSVTAIGVLELDISDTEDEARALAIATHELGHVLGFGALWERSGLLVDRTDERGQVVPYFLGSSATRAFTAAGGKGDGVPVKSEGNAESARGHWEEDIFGSELMTSMLGGGLSPLSSVTIGSLADLGYEVDETSADPFTIKSK